MTGRGGEPGGVFGRLEGANGGDAAGTKAGNPFDVVYRGDAAQGEQRQAFAAGRLEAAEAGQIVAPLGFAGGGPDRAKHGVVAELIAGAGHVDLWRVAGAPLQQALTGFLAGR